MRNAPAIMRVVVVHHLVDFNFSSCGQSSPATFSMRENEEAEWDEREKRRRRRFSSERDTAGRIHKAAARGELLLLVPSSPGDSSQKIINKRQ